MSGGAGEYVGDVVREVETSPPASRTPGRLSSDLGKKLRATWIEPFTHRCCCVLNGVHARPGARQGNRPAGQKTNRHPASWAPVAQVEVLGERVGLPSARADHAGLPGATPAVPLKLKKRCPCIRAECSMRKWPSSEIAWLLQRRVVSVQDAPIAPAPCRPAGLRSTERGRAGCWEGGTTSASKTARSSPRAHSRPCWSAPALAVGGPRSPLAAGGLRNVIAWRRRISAIFPAASIPVVLRPFEVVQNLDLEPVSGMI